MNVPRFMKSFAHITHKYLSPNLGTMLLWTGAIGWALSSLAQVTAVAINPKIPKDQKKFLIPQEIADAAVNIASFIVITRHCQKFGEKLVSTGRIATPHIRNFLKTNGLESKVCKKTFDISNQEAFIANKEFQKTYGKLFDGVSFISSTIGSIISCNIVTPYIRNYFGAKSQKYSMAKDKMQNSIILPTSPVLPAQNPIGIDAYAKRATLKSTYPSPSSSLKI